MNPVKYIAPFLRHLWLVAVAMVVLAVGIALRAPLEAAFVYWWGRIGPVMLGLLPLSVLLCGIVVWLLIEPHARPPWIKKWLTVVALAAPSLGLLGTVVGTVEGLKDFSLANGAKELVENVARLMKGLSIALESTAWGALLSIPAEILLATLYHDEPAGKAKVIVLHSNPAMPPVKDSIDNEGGVR